MDISHFFLQNGYLTCLSFELLYMMPLWKILYICFLCECMFSFFLSVYLRVEFLGHVAILYLKFLRICQSSLKPLHRFTFPSALKYLVSLHSCKRASLVAQMVKLLPTMWETWVQSLGREDPLEKEMATHSSIHAWKIPRTKEPGGLQSMAWGRKESDTTEQLHFHLPTWVTIFFSWSIIDI